MNSISLNAKHIGEGPPLLIAHGLFGSLDNWQTIARKLAEQGYQVHSLDMRNHGKSSHVNEMSHNAMAADIEGYIVENGLEEVTLIGHSMGGKTAMQLALTRPELIAKLVVVDIAPKPYSPHHSTYFDAMNALPIHTLSSRKEADKALQQQVKNVAIRQFLLKNLDRAEQGFQWKFNLKALEDNYSSLIGGIQGGTPFTKPTLFIGGQQSDYISVADHAMIHQLFPEASIKIVEDAGHWVHAEQPAAFLELVLTFIKSNH